MRVANLQRIECKCPTFPPLHQHSQVMCLCSSWHLQTTTNKGEMTCWQCRTHQYMVMSIYHNG